MNEQPKVFGIGFHKTATSSLRTALETLGYVVGEKVNRPLRFPPVTTETVLARAFALVDSGRYTAFRDTPWPIIYRELDERYPGSKFILTVRPTDPWIQSIMRHFDDYSTPMREWIYGVGAPRGHEDVYIARYERHNREVMAYFHDRPDDLLVLNVATDNKWEKLCRFLDKEVPTIPYPHKNVQLRAEDMPRIDFEAMAQPNL